MNEENEKLMGCMEEEKDDNFVLEGDDLTWNVVAIVFR